MKEESQMNSKVQQNPPDLPKLVLRLTPKLQACISSTVFRAKPCTKETEDVLVAQVA